MLLARPATLHTVAVTNPRGYKTTYCSDKASDRVAQTIAADNDSTSTGYTPHGEVNSVRQPGTAAASTATYDTSTTNPTFNPKTTTGAAGEQTALGYSDPATDSLRLRYLPKTSTNEQGRGKSYGYDQGVSGGPGNLTQIADSASAASNQATLAYNTNGTVKTATDGKGSVTTYSYDAKGNRIKVTPPPKGDGTKLIGDTVIDYAKDASGVVTLSRVSKVTDGDGRSKTYAYDNLDRVVRVTNGDGSYTDSTFDADGYLTKQTDVAGTVSKAKSITPDALGRTTKEVFPDGTSWSSPGSVDTG